MVLIGRIILGGYFTFSGLNHFLRTEQLEGWVESKGLPFSRSAVLITGGQLVFGGLGILVGEAPLLSVGALAVFLLGASLLIHDFWNLDGEERQTHMVNFLKNIALIGGLLFYLAFASYTGIEYSLGLEIQALL